MNKTFKLKQIPLRAGRKAVSDTNKSVVVLSKTSRLIALQQTVGNRILGNLTVSQLLRRSPAEETQGEATARFEPAKWFNKFEKAVTFTLSRFYIGRNRVWVKQVAQFAGQDDKRSPAHYNPNDRTIYFSNLGFRAIFDDRVIDKKEWSIEDYSDCVIETAAHESFHAYQDTPRFRSSGFAELEKKIGPKLLIEISRFVRSGVVDTYEKFKSLAVPYFTNKYLPESQISVFIGENLPGQHRDQDWQLSARTEIENQWLKILEDRYFRARSIHSSLKKGITGTGLKPEQKHTVSRVEKQAEKFAEMRKTEIKLWLLTRELEDERNPTKQTELKIKIKELKKELDIRNIPVLEKQIASLKTEFGKLDPNKKEDMARIEKIVDEWTALEERLDALISLRDGIEAVFKKSDLLI